MATLLRPPLVSGSQRKSSIGFAFVAANLLVTTLASTPPSIPPGEQLSDSAPQIKRQVIAQQGPNLLGTTLSAVYMPASVQDFGSYQSKRGVGYDSYPNLLSSTLGTLPALALPLNAERWDDSAPVIRKDVSCWQQPSVLVRGINPNAKVMGWTDSAPSIRQIGDIDPLPTLLTTTLAPTPATLALPLNAERWDDSAPPPKTPVYAVQQHNLLILGINPNAQVAQLDDSAPRIRQTVQVDIYPNLLVTNLVAAPVPFLPVDTSQLQPKYQLGQDPGYRPLTLGINPNAKPLGLTDSAPPPKRPVTVDVYPNLLVTTLYTGPTEFPVRQRFIAAGDSYFIASADIRYSVK